MKCGLNLTGKDVQLVVCGILDLKRVANERLGAMKRSIEEPVVETIDQSAGAGGAVSDDVLKVSAEVANEQDALFKHLEPHAAATAKERLGIALQHAKAAVLGPFARGWTGHW